MGKGKGTKGRREGGRADTAKDRGKDPAGAAHGTRRTEHRICGVEAGSIAQEMGVEAGDLLCAVNGQPVEDIFDYRYLTADSYLEVLVRKPSGEEWLLEVEKDEGEDLGLIFENGLMDEYRSCQNHCIFCFIDQMPPGMRETLYFKDDDARLSFLQGNYITLTNLSDHDVDRILHYHLSPINISFHTTEPALRCRMLNNRFAGKALEIVKRFCDAGTEMNGQVVLCKGINDGAHLERTISDLTACLPFLRSLSVVPVGLTRYRDGLYPLEPFSAEDARRVIERVEAWQRKLYPQWGLHFVHASDEWYLMAGQDLPEANRYDGYLQLENGVGMMRLFIDEFRAVCEKLQEKDAPRLWRERSRQEGQGREGSARESRGRQGAVRENRGRRVSIVTGTLAFPVFQGLVEGLSRLFPGLTVFLYPIRNDFFGRRITVTGLLTGQDICAQLDGRELGRELLLPENTLRSGEDVFLDDMTVGELSAALQVPVNIVKSNGSAFVEAILGTDFLKAVDAGLGVMRGK